MTPDKREEDIHRTAGVLFTQFLLRQMMLPEMHRPGPKGRLVDYHDEMHNCAQIAIQIHDATAAELDHYTKTGEFTKLPWHKDAR